MSTFTPSISQTDAAAELVDLIAARAGATTAPADRVYVISRHVSASGMTRYVSLFVMRNGAPEDITVRAAAVLGDKVDDGKGHFALKVSGAGMDMHFHTVYRLSCALYGNQGGYTLTHETL